MLLLLSTTTNVFMEKNKIKGILSIALKVYLLSDSKVIKIQLSMKFLLLIKTKNAEV